MGFDSPMASAKRRMAPFSTSFVAGFASRPVALRSTTMLSLSTRRKVQNADQPGLAALHQRRRVDHGPYRGLVSRRPAWNQDLDARVPDQLDLVARLRSAESDGEVQERHFLPLVEGARHLLDADDAALGHREPVALHVLVGLDR